MTSPAIELIQTQFRWPGQDQWTVNIEEWRVWSGERVLLKGPSGCGKSTLLSLLGGVILPESGQVRVLGQDLSQLNASQRDRFRGEHIGFIFQQFNLLPWMSGIENVLLALQWSPSRRSRVSHPSQQAENDLIALGLTANEWLRPAGQLSVGQQQRVAVARALLGHPPIIIADEPTSALDAGLQDQFIALLMQACQRHASTLVFVSHDEQLGCHFDRQVSLLELQKAHVLTVEART